MDHVLKTIDDAKAKLRQIEDEAQRLRMFINQCCVFAGIAPMYGEADAVSGREAALTVARNSFFGRPLTTCVREFLLMREKASGNPSPASLDEIFGALKSGGYDLATVSNNGEDQKRGVAISLGKNSSTFVRLPTGDWGLLEWYPNIKEKKKKSGESADKGSAEASNPETASSDPNNTESEATAVEPAVLSEKTEDVMG